MRYVVVSALAGAAICFLCASGCGSQETAAAVPQPLPGVEVFPFRDDAAEARQLGQAVSLILDRALGNSCALPARLSHTGHLAMILRSERLGALDAVGPEEAAKVIGRADETAAVCGKVMGTPGHWRVECCAYDRHAQPLGEPTVLVGTVEDIERGLPAAADALARQLAVPTEESERMREWSRVPEGALQSLIAALAATTPKERLARLLEMAGRYPQFSVPHTLALESYVLAAQEVEDVGGREPYDALRDRIADRFQEELDALAAAAHYSLTHGDIVAAERISRQMRDLCADCVSTRMMMATVAERRDDHVRAIALRKLIVRRQEKSASAAYGLARSLVERGLAVRHGQYFSQMTQENQQVFVESVEEALRQAQRAAELDPDRGDIWSMVFQCAMENGEEELARTALDRAITLTPYDPDLWSHAWYFFSPGYEDERSEWLRLQRRLLTAGEGSFGDVYRMARALDDYRMGFMGADTEVIMDLFRRALKLRPESGRARADYVQALLAMNEVEEAAREFARLEEGRDIPTAAYHLTRGLVLRHQGQLAEAREALQQSKEAGGDYFWNVRCDTWIAETYVHEGGLDSAQDILEGVYATWTQFYDVNYLLAYVYHKQGNDADALGVLSSIEPERRANIWVTATVPASAYPLDDLAIPDVAPEPPSPKVPEGWKLAFSDEFNREEIGPDWTVRHGDWTVRSGTLRANGGNGFQLIEVPGVYADAQIEFEMMCESTQAWAGAFLRNPGEGLGDQRGYLRFLSWGDAELFNIHPANRFFIDYLPTISPRDWWWVRVRVQERDAAAWISRDRQEWVCADWGGLMDTVPESGRILLSVREGPQRAAFRQFKLYAPAD